MQPRLGMVLADDKQLITHVNPDFCMMTGYSSAESVGRNCSFLQGCGTDPNTVSIIRETLAKKEECRIAILNYRKNGSSFWNLLTISPFVDGEGNVASYVGIQMIQQRSYVDTYLGAFAWTNMKSHYRHTFPEKSIMDQQLLQEEREDAILVADFKAGKLESVIPPEATRMPKAVGVTFVAETNLPIHGKGKYRVRCYEDPRKNAKEAEIICICWGELQGREDVAVRVHDQCFTSEVLGSMKCDCKEQLHYSMDYIRDPDNFHDHHHHDAHGMVVYMPQEGRGIGLGNKIKAYSMQELGLDTVDANRILGFEDDTRDYSAVPAILDLMDIKSIRLMTNNPRKVSQLQKLGAQVSGTIPIIMDTNQHSHNYLTVKQSRMGHSYGF